MKTIYKGKIVGFSGSYGSGIATLMIERGGVVEAVHCENAPTVRALEHAFGNVIGAGHSVKKDAGFMNKEIYFTMEFGILASFTPVECAHPKFSEGYKKQFIGNINLN